MGCCVGEADGSAEGFADGLELGGAEGDLDGSAEGMYVGLTVGGCVGLRVGELEGAGVGLTLGHVDGKIDGWCDIVGTCVGNRVGSLVTSPHSIRHAHGQEIMSSVVSSFVKPIISVTLQSNVVCPPHGSDRAEKKRGSSRHVLSQPGKQAPSPSLPAARLRRLLAPPNISLGLSTIANTS